MSESLLAHYSRELDALRHLAGEFAASHPKIAGRLRLNEGSVDDPHVERLLEGAAFLSARVQARLDDELPEISDALLGVLYPNYLAPVPSGAIVRFAPRSEIRVPIKIPLDAAIETDPVEGEPCRFRTTSEVTLWPVEIGQIRLSGLPLAAPVHPGAAGAASCLRAVLRLPDPDASFGELGLGALRCFLRGPTEQALRLHELLTGHVLGVALADGPNDDRPTLLGPSAVRPVGFEPDEALWPTSARSFSGFRLLSEYFALPEKFLFVDLCGLEARTLVQAGNQIEMFIYFDRAAPELERRLAPDCLQLGCTPVINLHRRKCEPIRLDGRRTEYPIHPDHRRRQALEVWSVEAVHEVGDDGSSRPWQPFYRQHTGASGGDAAGFFNVIRRDSAGGVGGTDVLLAPFDPVFSVDAAADRVLSVDALCTNRDLPGRLPFGGGQPRLRLVEGIASVASVTCLTAPTPSFRASLRERRSWRLISQLSLGHLSVVGGPEAAATLRELLRLYDCRDTAESRAAIEGLSSVSSCGATARVPGARPGSFCRGLNVTLEFDAKAWESNGLHLLATVLDRFMALHATANSFVRTTALLQGRSGSAVRFPPRAGSRVLL